MSARLLAVRLDNAGDVVLTGPALRALRAGADEVVVLAGPHGAEAARLLPGGDEVLVWRCPWIDGQPPRVDAAHVARLVADLAQRGFDGAVIFTSFHQSPLPTALLLRLAGVPWIAAISVDYPGSLLDVRHNVDEDIPEAERALSLCRAAGFQLPSGDDGRLRLRSPLPDVADLVGSGRYVVLHPGTSVPARAWPVEWYAEAARLLAHDGWQVVVTGSGAETALCELATGGVGINLAGRTTMPRLANVISGAAAVVVGNTGPAHLAAAVGSPVVSLYAPTVPAVRWAPYRVPHVLLGDQDAACRDTRATHCPVPGHPCLTSVSPHRVVAAVHELTEGSQLVGASPAGAALLPRPKDGIR
ncbi:MAG: glycosyltransferase family 9 protein [Nocardioidaceae bacterium]|nr:glycosyltransferase family 9 protein [Nocardioidaceae bacterium]